MSAPLGLPLCGRGHAITLSSQRHYRHVDPGDAVTNPLVHKLRVTTIL